MFWRKYLKALRWALPAAILAASVPAMSLLVRPILIDMKSSGSGTNSSFEVVNDRNRSIAVEIAVQNLIVPEKGNISLTPNDGANFQIFPPIASIPAGKKQVFRVKWIGTPDLAKSELYMFSTSELPVKREADDVTSVQVLYAINSVVAVAPANIRPEISIANVERTTSKEGKAGLEITFANSSAAHGYVASSEINLSIAGSDWSATLDEGSIGKSFGLGLVPANAKRVMFVALDGVPPTGQIAAEYKQVFGRRRKAL